MRRLSLYIVVILLISISFGCNTDYDGIFNQISESEAKVTVGAVSLIAKEGDTIYSLTSAKGLQTYDITSKTWSAITDTLFNDVRYTAFDSATKTIYSANRAPSDGNNQLISYVITTEAVSSEGFFPIYDMGRQYDLMLTKDGTTYTVKKASDQQPLHNDLENLTFHETIPPHLIVQNDTCFIVSGKNTANDAYVHEFWNNGAKITLTGVTNAIIAMYYDDVTTDLLVISSDGKIWYGDPNTLTEGSTLTLPTRRAQDFPCAVFYYDTRVYIQGANNVFYEIDPSDGTFVRSEDLSSAFVAIAAHSYILEGTTLYVGTVENGIRIFTF